MTKTQSGMVAADRIFALYDRQPAVGANADGPMVPRHEQTISFKNVSFSYLPGRSAQIRLKAVGDLATDVKPRNPSKSRTRAELRHAN